MNPSIGYIFAIIFVVIALNFYFLVFRIKRGNKSTRRRRSHIAVDEAKQALWRDKEVARRIEREEEDARERAILRNETLDLYEQVRRRHAFDDALEGIYTEGGIDNEASERYPGNEESEGEIRDKASDT